MQDQIRQNHFSAHMTSDLGAHKGSRDVHIIGSNQRRPLFDPLSPSFYSFIELYISSYYASEGHQPILTQLGRQFRHDFCNQIKMCDLFEYL